jgi:phasin family protein
MTQENQQKIDPNSAAPKQENVVDMKAPTESAVQPKATAENASSSPAPSPASSPAAAQKPLVNKESSAKAVVKKKPVAKPVKKAVLQKAKPAVASKPTLQKQSNAKQKNQVANIFKPFAPSNLKLTNPMEILMTQKNPQFDKMAQEAANASRESFDALTKSYSIFTKGCESMMRTTMAISQTAAEKQAEYAKQAMSCKTVNEFAEFQNKIAQASFDDMMSNVTQMTEMSTKILTESAEPINNQLGKAMKKMSTAA